MAGGRALVHTIVLILLPIAVAAFGWSLATAIVLVLVMILWRWLIVLSNLVWPERTPALVLDTISVSHFVEKVRWNLDVAGIEYVEKPAGGTLGAYFLGRTVPRLRVRTGVVQSHIGNSAEILRYLWGAYYASHGDAVRHLEPTPERVAFEQQLDRHGANLQVWIYHHLLDNRELTLRLWGADSPDVPLWQRWTLRLLFPLLRILIRRTFRITPRSVEKAGHYIDELLAHVDMQLADGRRSILGGDTLNYTDYTFAAMTGVWLAPPGYGGGRAEHVRIDRDQASDAMRADIERWSEDHPRVVSWVQELYARERMPTGETGAAETTAAAHGQTA